MAFQLTVRDSNSFIEDCHRCSTGFTSGVDRCPVHVTDNTHEFLNQDYSSKFNYNDSLDALS